jgi:hypothetical protein
MKKGLLALVAAIGLGGNALAAPDSLGEVSSFPRAVAVNSGTPILVSVRIDDPTILPDSVFAFLADGLGRPTTRLGVLNDAGRAGDAVPGDGVYSASLLIPTSTAGSVSIRVTAAFRGALRRVDSLLGFIEVAAGVDPTLPIATPTASSLRLVAQSGATVFQMPLRLDERTVSIPPDGSGEDTTITTDKAVLSPYGTAASIYSTAFSFKTLTDPADTNGEHALSLSQFSLVRGVGLAWTRTAPEGTSYYLGDGLLSGNGEAALLLECDESCSRPSISVVSASNTTSLTFRTALGAVHGARISVDGRYIAYLGRVAGAPLEREFSFVVVEVSSRRSWTFGFGYSPLGTDVAETTDGRFALVRGDGSVTALLP